ncbi:MAG: DUF192 domain-containing protein [Candidatus Aenigmarchaeota archaeon]|nr:DUF192 domain-containing protein [Candidatus Aenigmarchaeota archaeon]
MPFFHVCINKKKFKIKDCKGAASIKGLMFDEMQDKDGALIYANSIWMPFVRQDLMLVFLDEKMRILKTEIAKPITLHPKTWKTYKHGSAKYCLELKNTDLKIRKGMSINLKKGP